MKKIIYIICLFGYGVGHCGFSDFSHELVYVSDLTSTVDGGVKRGTVLLGNANLVLQNTNFDLFNLQENELYINISANHGEDPSRYSGDYGITSSIEAPANTIKLYEFYNKKAFANNRGYFLFGLHDLNTVFYTSEPAGLFLNSTYGIGAELGQVGGNGPSIYPTTSVATIVSLNFLENSSITLGLYDGLSGNPEKPIGNHVRVADDEGYLFILEYALAMTDENFKIGFWNHSKEIEKLSDSNKSGENRGAYIIYDKKVSNVSTFIKYGIANEELNQFSQNLILGFVYDRPFTSDKENELAL